MLGDVRLARNKTTAVTCHDRLTKSSHDYVAVGIPVTGYPPHRSRRARFTHRAPASGVWR